MAAGRKGAGGAAGPQSESGPGCTRRAPSLPASLWVKKDVGLCGRPEGRVCLLAPHRGHGNAAPIRHPD